MSKGKEVRDFIRELEAKGWRRKRVTGTGHIMMIGPQGVSTIFPYSPSDHRWLKNKRCEIRRIERGVPQ